MARLAAPARGGKRSRLHLLTSPEKLFSQNVNKLLEKQDYGNVLRFIGNDKYLLDRLSLWRFGVQDKSSETRVRIPYYRNLIRLTHSSPAADRTPPSAPVPERTDAL